MQLCSSGNLPPPPFCPAIILRAHVHILFSDPVHSSDLKMFPQGTVVHYVHPMKKPVLAVVQGPSPMANSTAAYCTITATEVVHDHAAVKHMTPVPATSPPSLQSLETSACWHHVPHTMSICACQRIPTSLQELAMYYALEGSKDLCRWWCPALGGGGGSLGNSAPGAQ